MPELKSYLSPTVESAMAQARLEHGSEVLLVGSRRSEDSTHSGLYEVTFALSSESGGWKLGNITPAGSDADSVRDEVVKLRRMVERVYQQVRFTRGTSEATAAGLVKSIEVELLLIELGFAPELAAEMAARTASEGVSLARTLAGQIQCRHSFFAPGKRSMLAFVGPPGSGKSTTIAKLAARAALHERKRTLILSLDSDRIGANFVLRELATILGVPFQALDGPGELRPALEEAQSRQLILIDTPGIGGRDGALLDQVLAALSEIRPDLETHLTLPVTTKLPDLALLRGRFASLQPAFLTFTRLDESRALGTLWNETKRWALPVGFVTFGQSVPEDLALPTAADLASLALKGSGS